MSVRYVRHVCTANKNNRKTDFNSVAITLDSAGTNVVSASVFKAKAILFIKEDMPIRIKEVDACDYDINCDRLVVGREIEATS